MGPPTGSRYQPPTDERVENNEDLDQDETDSPARLRGNRSVRRRTSEHVYRRNTTTTDEVLGETRDYVLNYMEDMFNQDGHEVELPSEFQEGRRHVNRYDETYGYFYA